LAAVLCISVNTRPPDHGQRQLLRARKERPCGCLSGNPFDECASSHCRPQGSKPVRIVLWNDAITAGICDRRRTGPEVFLRGINCSKFRLAIGFWGPVPITTWPRSASAVLPRAKEEICYRSTRRLFSRMRLAIVGRLGKRRVAALILAAV